MTSISSNSEFVVVSCGLITCVVRLCDGEIVNISHAEFNEKCSTKTNHVDNDELGLGLLCTDISPCGQLLAFCTLAKRLCIVPLHGSEVFTKAVFRLARGASKVKFTPITKNVVIADKSGDVYLFNPKEENCVGHLILGHLSLLLDVLVTPDEKFIITSDRDEKIRVSSFPNGYNIIAYCLGHTEFVSSIMLLPHHDSYLISTSGDGTVRFWDYKFGTELLICNTLDYLVSNSIEDQPDENTSAVTDASAIIVNSSTSFVCLCLDRYKVCMLLKCISENGRLHYDLIQNVTLENVSPLRVVISSNILWLLLNSTGNVSVKAMKFNFNLCSVEDDLPENVKKVVNILNNQTFVVDYKNDAVNLLFKRKFENVQNYLNKKDARFTKLEHSIKKIKK